MIAATIPKMQCPACGSESVVLDTRETDGGARVVRRRVCKDQGHRFSTDETLGVIRVRKARRNFELFDKAKLVRGIERAIYKRPIQDPNLKAKQAADRIEARLRAAGQQEIDHKALGDLVLEELKDIDWQAWVRYATVLHSYTREELIEKVNALPPSETAPQDDD